MGAPSIPPEPEPAAVPPDPLLGGVVPLVIGLIVLLALMAGIFVMGQRRS